MEMIVVNIAAWQHTETKAVCSSFNKNQGSLDFGKTRSPTTRIKTTIDDG